MLPVSLIDTVPGVGFGDFIAVCKALISIAIIAKASHFFYVTGGKLRLREGRPLALPILGHHVTRIVLGGPNE